MASALTAVRKKKGLGSFITLVFQCVLSGNYTNSGGVGNAGTPGETLNFNGAANPLKLARFKLPQPLAGKLPPNTDIRVTRVPAGYDAQVEQNAANPTAANYVLRIFTTGGTELAGGAYPAGLLDATGLLIEVDIPNKYA